METIIISHVFGKPYYESKGKYAKKYLVSVCGVSNKPSKLMKPQLWEMPFDTSSEAQDKIKEYLNMLTKSKGSFIILKAK